MDRQRQDARRYYRPGPLYPRMNCACNNSAATAYSRSGGNETSPGSEMGAACQSSQTCLPFTSLAMVYAPSQTFRQIYSIEKALQRGTAFQELDLPFGRGKRC